MKMKMKKEWYENGFYDESECFVFRLRRDMIIMDCFPRFNIKFIIQFQLSLYSYEERFTSLFE